MPKNLLNDEELKQLVSGSEYLSGAFPGHAVPAISPHSSRVAARGTARRISNARVFHAAQGGREAFFRRVAIARGTRGAGAPRARTHDPHRVRANPRL